MDLQWVCMREWESKVCIVLVVLMVMVVLRKVKVGATLDRSRAEILTFLTHFLFYFRRRSRAEIFLFNIFGASPALI